MLRSLKIKAGVDCWYDSRKHFNFKNLSEPSERDYLKIEYFKTNRYFSDNKCKYEYLWWYFVARGWSIMWHVALAGRKIHLAEDKRGLNKFQIYHPSSLSIFVWRTVVLEINRIIYKGTRNWSTKRVKTRTTFSC